MTLLLEQVMEMMAACGRIDATISDKDGPIFSIHGMGYGLVRDVMLLRPSYTTVFNDPLAPAPAPPAPSYVVADGKIRRDAEACKCPKCGGYAEEDGTGPTQQEVDEVQTCGRFYACCINAFICGLCGQRIIAHLESPEAGW